MFLCSHDKVVGLVFVIDNILEGDAQLIVQIVEEVLEQLQTFIFI